MRGHRAQWSPARPVAVDDSDVLTVRDNRLHIEGIPAAELVARFGSPLSVVSETRLRTMTRRIRAAFEKGWPDGPVDVLPAFKANTTLATRRVLTEEGAGADVYSPGELEGVLRTGVEPALVSVNGGGKSREHLRRCVEAGVRVTVEDLDEIDLIAEVAREAGRRAQVRLRLKLTLPEAWRQTDFTPMSVPTDIAVQIYKSGIPLEHAEEVGRRALRHPEIDLVGLHTHLGRQHPGTRFWEHAMTAFGRAIGELSRAWGGWRPSEIDVGGGMASPRDPLNKEMPRKEIITSYLGYPLLVALRCLGARPYHAVLAKVLPATTGHPGWDPAPPVEEYAAAITGALRAELRRQGVPTAGVRLQTEPGRSLYGSAGVHLTTVSVVKRQTLPFPYSWVLTDTSEFFLAGGRLERNRYPYLVADRAEDEPAMTADIVGRSCFGDQLVIGAPLPEVRRGDVIAFLETGAYQDVSASNFNALPRPATVLVNGTDAEIIRSAESVEDVYSRDVVPDRLRTAAHQPGQARTR